jgi:hypothetical protein
VKKNWPWIALLVAVFGVGAGVIGWRQMNPPADPPHLPEVVELAPGPDTGDGGEMYAIYPTFDDGFSPDSERTMRFGLKIIAVKDKSTPTGYKQLSWHPEGITSNACLRLDGVPYLFGHAPGQWVTMKAKLGKDAEGYTRLGAKSVWQVGPPPHSPSFPECGNLLRSQTLWPVGPVLQVTQTVEIVRGPLTGKFDTCDIHYRLKNIDTKPHKVGLRYLLDTLVGTNDGAPFIVPKLDWLCEKQWEFNNPAKVPPFVFALEEMKLNAPGIVALIGLKSPALVEAPVRVTLSGWPNEEKVKGAKGGLTLWDVPIFPLNKFQDSAATIYWAEQDLPPGASRDVGFTYGLGRFGGNKDGSLGFFLAGDPRMGGELVVTALVRDAEAGQKVTLKANPGCTFVSGAAEQIIPHPPLGTYPFSPVAWTLRPSQCGKLTLRLESGGAVHEETVEIRQ